MRLVIVHRPVQCLPVTIAIGASVWAVHYVVTTTRNPEHDAESLLLIRPLLYLLLLAAGLVVGNAVRTPAVAVESGTNARRPFDWRRAALVGSLPVFGFAVVNAGFLLSSVVYVLVMCCILGVRRIVPLTLIACGVTALIVAGFVELLGVPLPLWPVP